MTAYDVTLYAGWDIDVYTLTLHLNGGALSKGSSLRIPAGTDFADTLCPQKDNYAFKGWFTDSRCRNEWRGSMPYSDLELYAGWEDYSSNAVYEIKDGEAVLIRYDCLEYESTVIYLPETVEGVPLTSIKAYAFFDEPITELHLPASLESIEENALRGMDKLGCELIENDCYYVCRIGRKWIAICCIQKTHLKKESLRYACIAYLPCSVVYLHPQRQNTLLRCCHACFHVLELPKGMIII